MLLLCALPALHARLAAAEVEARARLATRLCGVGVALILPTLGVELYAMPAIGLIYLAGNVSIAPAVSLIYIGGATLVMRLGLLLLAIGAIMLATAVARSRALPRWAAIVYAIGSPPGARCSRRSSAPWTGSSSGSGELRSRGR